MKNYIFVLALLGLTGCVGYELDKLDVSDKNNELLIPPCDQK